MAISETTLERALLDVEQLRGMLREKDRTISRLRHELAAVRQQERQCAICGSQYQSLTEAQDCYVRHQRIV